MNKIIATDEYAKSLQWNSNITDKRGDKMMDTMSELTIGENCAGAKTNLEIILTNSRMGMRIQSGKATTN